MNYVEPPIMTIKSARLAFGTNQLFEDVNFSINRGDKISLVGRNGCGKSTLLKVISGILEPDDGEIFIQPHTKISYMPQEPDFSGYKTLREVVLSGLANEEENLHYKADILIKELAIRENQAPEESSGGERKKAALAKALIGEPDILLLDEPTNHLDMPTIEKLEEVIKNFKGAIILISHDRMFLCNTSHVTFWLDRGILRRNNKGFKFFEEWQEQIINQEIIEQKHLNKKLEEETEWLHKGVTARRRRNMGRLRRLQQLRQERKEQLKQIGSVKLEAEEADLRSKMVIEAKHINKSYGDRIIVKDFSTRVIKGNKIGIVGPNGAGKTTLIKLLTKRLDADSGYVRIGKNLEEAYFDQNRDTLDPKKTLWQTLCDKGDHILVRGKYRHVVAYLKDFLFKPDQAKCPVAALSGGEKNRLMLAVALAKKSNFLVLDEPTNDLDMDTLDLLQEVLSEYEGTIIIVSHDRDFLDRVVTSVIYMGGDGNVSEHAGSYSDLLEKQQNKIPLKNIENKNISPVKNKNDKQTKKTVKLSYNQQRLLDILPQKIADLEQKKQEIENVLSDANLYTSDANKFNMLSEQHKQIIQEIEESENQWLEIQILKENMEQ